jgi:hypothetical protein
MFTNAPAFDWFTLTTWSREIFGYMQRIAEHYAIAPGYDARRMQYRGVQYGGVFVGDGIQQERQHYLLQASGMDAHIIYPDALQMPVKATRIDLQCTVQRPADWKAIDVAGALRAYPPDAWGKGGRRKIVVYDDEGWDTIYIGSRASDRVIRLYVKPDDTGAPFLRFEVEYKGSLAPQIFDECRIVTDVESHIGGILLDEIEAIPGLSGVLPEKMLSACRMGRPGTRPKHLRTPSMGRTAQWLMRQVQPAIMRAMADHDEGPMIRALIRAWSNDANMIDELLWSVDTQDIDG